ncbi:NAD-dependent deacylase [Azohydromonas sp.]|uniref:SIR2 family NAD-dependent protein deacylase n=1 Tax=Azohydromonas sp. TaxID=1872666 RepID=UPI002C4AC251|nr:NAD-dependent deacylase [Azohydromonas sp.]HMM85936.1 NAD-dependent deacylase [Azohydromonas sp.]
MAEAPDPVALAAVRAHVDAARRVCVLTGAGMSAESGIATFRDPATGLWSKFDPAVLASVEGFRAQPQHVWDWYAQRREGMRRARPNAGHLALAAFGRQRPGVLTVVTQNVDDLHQRAGWPETIRLHGDILAARWLTPCPRGKACDPAAAAVGRPPRCAECGNLVRPDVVWFGEMLPERAVDAAEHAARRCDLMLVVGTSGAVWPAAGLAHTARRAGARVAIVNPDDSEIDDEAHWVLRGTAATLLPPLLDTRR